MIQNFKSWPLYQKEAHAILKLAAPVWIAQLAFNAAGFVDTVMAGHVGAIDLAGVAVGASTWIPMLFAMTGLLLAVNPIASQMYGADRKERIPEVLHHALFVAMAAGICAALLLQNLSPLFSWMDTPEDVVFVTENYLTGLGLGVPAMAGYLVLKNIAESMGDTRPQMIISLIGLACNITGNFIFIHGAGKIPAMGGAGCGWASGITFWCMFLMMGSYLITAPRYRKLQWLRPFRWQKKRVTEILRLGGPISLTLFMEASIFGCVTLFIGGLGAVVVAGHQVALSVSGLVYSIPLSIGTAVTVRVGQAIGRKSPKEAQRTICSGMGASIGIALITLVATIFFRHEIVGFYSPDPSVQSIAAGLLIFAALFQLSDAVMTTSLGALRGYKDTRIPMWLTFVAYWGIALPLGYLLGLTDHLAPPMGASGFWISLITGLTAAGLLLGIRVFHVSKTERQKQGGAGNLPPG